MCTACQRVSTTPMARIPPMSSETTAATAFQRISFSAGSWNTSPVVGQVLNIRLTDIRASPFPVPYFTT